MKDSIVVSPQDADFLHEKMQSEPNEKYTVEQFHPREKRLVINVDGRSINAKVPYNTSQIHSLSRARYVHVGFKRLGDAIGLTITTC